MIMMMKRARMTMMMRKMMMMMMKARMMMTMTVFLVNTWIKRPSPKPDTAVADDGQEGNKVGG